LATRSPRRVSSRPASAKPRRKGKGPADRNAAAEGFEEIAARAARLGITPERVLQEYAHIAFADLRHIVKDGEGGELHIATLDSLSDADAAAIQEIVAGAEGKRPARVKLYDKKAALDAIARHLGMFPPAPHHRDADPPTDLAEDAREELARRLARIAAGSASA
jgi:hypothetical protein